MSDYILKKIYPQPDNTTYECLAYDSEGLWSITHPKEADMISQKIYEMDGNENTKVVDLTAGCGGNLISFCNYFKNIVGIEIDKKRFDILKNNMDCYNLENTNLDLINDDSIKYLQNNNENNIYFIDPPWGGPNYKKNSNLELFLSNTPLPEIIKMMSTNKLVVLKIPFNYNYEYIKTKYRLIDTIKIKNMIIIFFYLN